MILITVCIAQFMAPFMLTSVGVALPSIGRDLGASAMQLGLVEQVYVLSLAMFMLTFGRLGDIIGLVSACTYAGLSTGPVIGGYVTLHFGWRHVFLMAVPIGISAIGMCLFGMKETEKNASGEQMDRAGSLAYAVSVGFIMTGAAHAQDAALGLPMIISGLIGLILFVRMEIRTKSPLLDIALLSGNRFFTLSCFAALGNYAATFGIIFLMSLFLQYAKGLSPRRALFCSCSL